jgi:hypothetical protein
MFQLSLGSSLSCLDDEKFPPRLYPTVAYNFCDTEGWNNSNERHGAKIERERERKNGRVNRPISLV